MSLLYLQRDISRLVDGLPANGYRRTRAIVLFEDPNDANPACQPSVSVLKGVIQEFTRSFFHWFDLLNTGPALITGFVQRL